MSDQGFDAQDFIDMAKDFTNEVGVLITWQEQETETNSRGRTVKTPGANVKTARVLILKEDYKALRPFAEAFGLTYDVTDYMIALPNVSIEKDMIVTDSDNKKWKLGPISPWRIADTVIVRTSKLTEVA